MHVGSRQRHISQDGVSELWSRQHSVRWPALAAGVAGLPSAEHQTLACSYDLEVMSVTCFGIGDVQVNPGTLSAGMQHQLVFECSDSNQHPANKVTNCCIKQPALEVSQTTHISCAGYQRQGRQSALICGRAVLSQEAAAQGCYTS